MSNPWDPIDTIHLGRPKVTAVYLAQTDDGLALIDTGPASAIAGVEQSLAARGVSFNDIRHVLLTHIHLDHAGAAGTLVRRFPHLEVHVSAIGAPHVVDPSRLEKSARMLYGDQFDHLWGELLPVPEEKLHVLGDSVLGLEVFAAPGHAKHMVNFVHPDGTIYCGDAAGVRIEPGRHILPITPPPDIDVEAWHRTISEIERRGPERLAIAHWGVKTDPADHLRRLRERLDIWTERVGSGITVDEFTRLDREDMAREGGGAAAAYEGAGPLVQCFAGLERYWLKRREREAAEAATAAGE